MCSYRTKIISQQQTYLLEKKDKGLTNKLSVYSTSIILSGIRIIFAQYREIIQSDY